MTDDGDGAHRRNDPPTSRKAARSLMVAKLKMGVLKTLAAATTPLNGWEMSVLMERQTITVVPRLCHLRRDGHIEEKGRRPGPQAKPWIKPRQQIAYIITARGRGVLAGIIPLDGLGGSQASGRVNAARVRELESELERLNEENMMLRQQLSIRGVLA